MSEITTKEFLEVTNKQPYLGGILNKVLLVAIGKVPKSFAQTFIVCLNDNALIPKAISLEDSWSYRPIHRRTVQQTSVDRRKEEWCPGQVLRVSKSAIYCQRMP